MQLLVIDAGPFGDGSQGCFSLRRHRAIACNDFAKDKPHRVSQVGEDEIAQFVAGIERQSDRSGQLHELRLGFLIA